MTNILLSTYNYYSRQKPDHSLRNLFIWIVIIFVIIIVIGCWVNSSERAKQEEIQAEKERREREAEWRRTQRERERREREQQRLAAEREAQIVKKRENLVHKYFITEQRKLMSDSMRYDVLRRDGFRCQLCGMSAKDGVRLHVDHIYPVSKGGKTEMSNLRTLCERCNIGKRDKIETSEQAKTENAASPYIRDYTSATNLFSAMREAGIKYKLHKGEGYSWIITRTDIDAFLSNSILRKGEIIQEELNGRKVWKIYGDRQSSGSAKPAIKRQYEKVGDLIYALRSSGIEIVLHNTGYFTWIYARPEIDDFMSTAEVKYAEIHHREDSNGKWIWVFYETPREKLKIQRSFDHDMPDKDNTDCQKYDFENYTLSDIIMLFNEKGIEYVDRTKVGGCLWVRYSKEYVDLMESIGVNGKRFEIAEKSKALSGNPGWFVRLNG